MRQTRTTTAPPGPTALDLAVKESRHLRELEECAALRSALCRRYPDAAHGLQALFIYPRALRQVDVFGTGRLPDAVWRRAGRELVAIRTDVRGRIYFVSSVADGIWLPPCRTVVSLPGRPALTLWNAERTREPDLLWLLGGVPRGAAPAPSHAGQDMTVSAKS